MRKWKILLALFAFGLVALGLALARPGRLAPAPTPPTLHQELTSIHEDYAKKLREIERLPKSEQEAAEARWRKERRDAARSAYRRHGESLPSGYPDKD